jgi:hypothetical protein
MLIGREPPLDEVSGFRYRRRLTTLNLRYTDAPAKRARRDDVDLVVLDAQPLRWQRCRVTSTRCSSASARVFARVDSRASPLIRWAVLRSEVYLELIRSVSLARRRFERAVDMIQR